MRSTRFARLGAVALLGGALLGCSAQKEDAAAGAGAASAASASAAAAAVDESSIEFFRVSVGDRVFFSVDSSDLTPEGRSTLDRQARWLTLNPDIAITLEGHADERGTREYNIALGARRANAVQAYLAGRGVDPRRMTTISWGRERPVEVCSEARCWDKNRRTVTVPQ